MVTGNEFAVKSIPKLPRKQNTPVEPYVQKLKNEVSIMRSIGPSLNIVYLSVHALSLLGFAFT